MSAKKIHYAGQMDDRTLCGRSVYTSPIGTDGLPEVSPDWAQVDCLLCWRKQS